MELSDSDDDSNVIEGVTARDNTEDSEEVANDAVGCVAETEVGSMEDMDDGDDIIVVEDTAWEEVDGPTAESEEVKVLDSVFVDDPTADSEGVKVLDSIDIDGFTDGSGDVRELDSVAVEAPSSDDVEVLISDNVEVCFDEDLGTVTGTVISMTEYLMLVTVVGDGTMVIETVVSDPFTV